MIRELPYRGGWRFGNEKRCLPGTRKEFLDYIVNWVENPQSERGLILFGQAGTGKSAIAHEVAHLFDKKCLGSYFAFLRKERSKDDAYQLFTTLARDLSDSNPAFKHALGMVVKDKSSLRSAREYRTLFECLLLEPLKNLPCFGPIVIIIDALDESGDTVGKSGLHTFLAQNLIDLPSNFRVFITSRPETGIVPAFANAMSVRTIYMNDAQLAAKTEQDIALYLRHELPKEVFEDYGVKLAKVAEGVFQWASVASSFINSPSNIGLSMKTRVDRLLGHSRGLNGEGLLDNLYEEVLKGFFESVQAQALFRSIIGLVLAAIEPLSINSLITLRRYAPIDNPEDSDPVLVLELLCHLGSLLSNVTSSDTTRPIVPLHSSFRDFLTSKTSNVFYVDIGDAHYQLAHSCLTIMLDNLKFNICKLESSHLANSDVPDLESRIAEYVPPTLSYACIYWDDHLGHVSFERKLFQKLRFLFEAKFLFWLEVLSIKNSVGLASPALSLLSVWLQREVGTSQNSTWHVVTCKFAIAFSIRGEELADIGERCVRVCAVFRNGSGKERSAYLYLCPPFRTKLFSDPQSIHSSISSNTDLGMRAVVSLAGIGNDDPGP
jgi:NACHT domain